MKRTHGTSSHHMGKAKPKQAKVHRRDHHHNGKRGGAKKRALTGMKI